MVLFMEYDDDEDGTAAALFADDVNDEDADDTWEGLQRTSATADALGQSRGRRFTWLRSCW